MHRTVKAALVVLLVAAGAGNAAAQRRRQVYIDDPPTFATLDRQDDTSRIGLQLEYTSFDSNAFGPRSDVTAFRFDIYGQYIGWSGWGGYGNVALSDTSSNFDDKSAIGNIEGGAIYILPGRGAADFVFHFGLTLPTADDSVRGAFSNQVAIYPRLTDIIQMWPHTMALRLAASPVLRSGNLVLRADLGLDLPLSHDDQYDRPGPLTRINVGGGIDPGSFAILGELVVVGNADEIDIDPNRSEFISNAAVSARFRAGTVEPGIALIFPLDSQIQDAVDFMLAASIQGVL